jgi:beta-xylosidase
MKHTPLSKLLAIGAVSAVALSTALAQTSTTTTTVPSTSTSVSTSSGTGVSATTSTSTSALDGTGTITTYTPGTEYIEMRTETTEKPVRYHYSKNTTVVDSTGAAVDMAMLRSDLPVRYSYVKEGDRMVISKITVQKPLAEIRRTETTTTTTTRK